MNSPGEAGTWEHALTYSSDQQGQIQVWVTYVEKGVKRCRSRRDENAVDADCRSQVFTKTT